MRVFSTIFFLSQLPERMRIGMAYIKAEYVEFDVMGGE